MAAPKKETLIKDLENVEECLIRTANREDIWQDRVIHGLAEAVYHLLLAEIKRCEAQESKK